MVEHKEHRYTFAGTDDPKEAREIIATVKSICEAVWFQRPAGKQ